MSSSEESFSSRNSSSSDEENQDSYGPGGYCKIDIGDKIGNYEISKKLGFGQFATVWSTTCDKAIKICRADEDYTEMMKKEISILSEIKNGPHCLRLHDNFLHESENGKHQIIVTNLCAMDLYELTKLHRNEDTALPLETSKSIIRQILTALRFLESKNIMHTDIKPENILINEFFNEPIGLPEQRVTVTLADFGTAIRTDEKAHVYGTTFEYRSPEQVFEESRLTPATDIWSAACVFSMNYFL